MSADMHTIEKVLTLLAETPPRIVALTANLNTDQLHTPLHPDEWSARDVLAHLRSCGDVWSDCIVTILNEDRPTIRAINPRTWITRTDYHQQAFQRLLDAFLKRRTELLAILEPLPPPDWFRSATVTGAGKTLERTVLFYAKWLAEHERSHIKQFKQIANGYTSE